MANNIFYFYYVPTWDWPPEGPIKLGNVITSIDKPEQPLYTAPLPDESDVYSSEKTEVEYSKEKLREGKFSILTTFLTILGVSVDVGAQWERSTDDLYIFQRVQTTQFIPQQSYLQKCVSADPVRRYLNRSRYRKPVYIITGLKTVHGAQAKSHILRSYGGTAAVAMDSTVWSSGAVPVSVQPGVEGKTETKRGTAFGGSSDFVLAFRVCKVRVVRKTGVVDEWEDYNKGAMLERRRESVEERLPEVVVESWEEPKAGDEGFDEDVLIEGDAKVACAIPRAAMEEDNGEE